MLVRLKHPIFSNIYDGKNWEFYFRGIFQQSTQTELKHHVPRLMTVVEPREITIQTGRLELPDLGQVVEEL